MKNFSFLRGQSGQTTVFQPASKNVQEVQPVNKTTVAVTSELSRVDRPQVLNKRSARWARRIAH